MGKFRVYFAATGDKRQKVFVQEVEIGFSRKEFITALLDIEDDYFRETGVPADVVKITAAENISEPSLNPRAAPIEEGDTVWRDWDAMDLDLFGSAADRAKVEEMIKTYKPLWEAGYGYGFLVEILFGEDDFGKYSSAN